MRSFIIIIISIIVFSCDKKKTNIYIKKDNVINTIKIDTLPLNKDYLQKAEISKNDSLVSIYESQQEEFRIFGYRNADKNSEKLIFFSPFTKEIEGNPFKCKFGSFYSYNSFKPKMKFIKFENNFAKIKIIDNTYNPNYFFFENKWIEFEKD